eukprot:m.249138 g.249138  ORF g.249138 m.249138 type:complete len:759 (+) comp17509_c1_seq1:149-2425(+)
MLLLLQLAACACLVAGFPRRAPLGTSVSTPIPMLALEGWSTTEQPAFTPASANHEFPFWFNASYNTMLNNGSDAMVALLVNSSLNGINQAAHLQLQSQDLMTHVVSPLNDGSGIAVRLYFHNVTLADHLYSWMQGQPGIPITFRSHQLMAFGMPRDGPTPAPDRPKPLDTPRWVVYVVTGAAVVILVILIAAVGFRNYRQPKQSRPAFDELGPYQHQRRQPIAPALDMTTSGFTTLHLAVFQGDITVAQQAIHKAGRSGSQSRAQSWGLTSTASAGSTTAPPSMSSPGSSTMFPNLDDLDDVMLDPSQSTPFDATSTQASTSPDIPSSSPSLSRGLESYHTSTQQPWSAASVREQQALASWRRLGLLDDPTPAPAPVGKGFQAPTLHAAVQRPRVDRTAMLAAINKQDDQGHTPLAWAVRLNNFGMMQFLIKQGADVSIRDKRGQSPLHIAAMCTTPELMCDYLLKNSADPNALDMEENTPLMFSCRVGCCDTVATLLRHGANVQLADKRGMTVLMHAASQGKPRVLQLLLKQNGATINLQDISGWTALMWAVAVNAIDAVRVLLSERSVSLSVTNDMKETVFHLAARRGNTAIIELLVQYQTTPPVDKAQSHMEPLGDMLQALSAKGLTPIDYAVQSGHRAVAQHLGHILCGLSAAAVKQEMVDDDEDQGVVSLLDDDSSEPLLSSPPSSATESATDRKDKREKRRLYMRKRRAQQRQQIQEMEHKVDTLNEENRALSQGLHQLQQEAAVLRQLLSA